MRAEIAHRGRAENFAPTEQPFAQAALVITGTQNKY
jgi:hypothetical protein